MKAPRKRMTQMPQAECDDYMRKLARHLQTLLPPGDSSKGVAFFFLLLAENAPEGDTAHDTNYIANADRRDAVRMLRETANRLDRGLTREVDKPDNPAADRRHAPTQPGVPSTADVQRMAEVVLFNLGGPRGAADKLSWESFYALSYLASLHVEGADGERPITG